MPKIFRTLSLVALTLLLVMSSTSAAQDTFLEDRQQEIEQKRQEIEERRQAQDELQRQALFNIKELDATNAQITEVDDALKQVNDWIAAAETRLGLVEVSRASAQQRVADAQQLAAEFESEIAEIRQQLQDQVIEIYLDLAYEENFLLEDGDPNRSARRQYYIEELGGDAQVLIDRLRRAHDDQQAATLQAEQAQTEINEAQSEIEAALADLADLREAQEKLQEEWNRRRAELEELIRIEHEASQEVENEISSLNEDISGIEDEIERERERIRLEEERRKREAEIRRLAELERQRLADLARLAEQERTGQFDNIDIPAHPEFFPPVPGPMGSGFGPRLHPIFGYVRHHSGVDYGANMGDDIQASASGEVTMAEERTGYGHTVVIDHGGGWSTLYAHLSRYNVSVGQQVQIGDVIGYIGSTGWSTGPHLHFEVRYKGSPRDPAIYLSSI